MSDERKITISGKPSTVKGTSVYKNGNYAGQLGEKNLKEDKVMLTGGKTSDSFPKPKPAAEMNGTISPIMAKCGSYRYGKKK